jgi:predicted dehydrogenase
MESRTSDLASGMNLLVIGAGSIGRRHARNLKNLGAKVSLFDVNADLLHTTCKTEGYIPCTNLESILKEEKPDAALVCTPSHLHIPVAQQMVQAGIDVFIEKPLSNALDGVDNLIRTVHENKCIAMVGFMLRFEPGLKYIKEKIRPENVAFARLEFGSYMPLWRKGVDYRTVYSANRSMGGGTILDDTHELDYACWLFGYPKNIVSVFGKFSSFDIDVEDTAMITFEYPDKLVSVHSDYLQRTYSRRCKICDREGYTIEWVFGHSVHVKDASNEEIFSYADTFDVNQLYIDEMKYFIGCIKQRVRPESGLENGYEIMKIALAAKHELSRL